MSYEYHMNLKNFKFNLSSMIKVKVDPRYKDHYDQYIVKPKTDDLGYTEFMLSDFINIYLTKDCGLPIFSEIYCMDGQEISSDFFYEKISMSDASKKCKSVRLCGEELSKLISFIEAFPHDNLANKHLIMILKIQRREVDYLSNSLWINIISRYVPMNKINELLFSDKKLWIVVK